MGATNFLTSASGKDVYAAYQNAISDARHEHGNDPYNGTISTTAGFTEIGRTLVKGLRRTTRYIILDAVASGGLWDGDAKKLNGKAMRVYRALENLPACPKWGDCYAMQLTSNTWAFAGLAAC